MKLLMIFHLVSIPMLERMELIFQEVNVKDRFG